MPISRNFDELPLILCGPLLRRVEATCLSVFVVLKEAALVQLILHDSPKPTSPALKDSSANTIPLGKHLHVLVITLNISSDTGQLQPSKNYGYDLRFMIDGQIHDLSSEGLLDGDHALVYETGQLPSFALPPFELNKVNIIHGSCRKPHGEGKDMLAALDEIIAADIADPLKRPHMLLLTGDQIYADDVSPPLLRTIHDTAQQLLGWTETFEPTAVDANLGMAAQTLTDNVVLFLNEAEKQLKDPSTLDPITNDILVYYRTQLTATKEALSNLENQLTDLFNPATLFTSAGIENGLQKWMLSFSAMLRLSSDFTPANFFDIPGYAMGYEERIKEQLDQWPAQANGTNKDQIITLIHDIVDNLDDLYFFLLNLFHATSPLTSTQGWGQIDRSAKPDAGDTQPAPTDANSNWNYVLSRIAPPQRSSELKEYAELSSDAMDAHLMFLGEFYMMYLFAWSDVLWPRDETGQLTVADFKDAVPNYGLAFSQRAVEEERANLLDFAQGLTKVRRVLANIPTYMIFDDHEVTDDWNLNRDWVQLVNQSLIGPRILRNGLIAYAVFQDWGNQPSDYLDSKSGRVILNTIQTPDNDAGSKPAVITEPNILNNFLSIGTHAFPPQSVRLQADRKQWHFTVEPHANQPHSPFQVIFLDTRTHRQFPSDGFLSELFSSIKTTFPQLVDVDPSLGAVVPPALLGPEALEKQLGEKLATDKLNIVVSPAPVFGVPLVEDVIQRIAVANSNPELYDDEAWQGNPTSFGRLMDTLKEKAGTNLDVVLLSGDVHYGFSNDIHFATADAPSSPAVGSKPHARVVQLCASSLKNETVTTRLIGRIGHAATPSEGWAMAGDNFEGLKHHLKLQAKNFNQDQIKFRSEEFWGESKWEFPPSEGAEGGVSDQWWAETSSFIDPMARFLLMKNISLLNVPNLVPSLLGATWTAVPALGRFLFVDAQGQGVFTKEQEKFTVYFLRDHELVENADVVGSNNIGQIQFTTHTPSAAATPRLQELTHYLHWYPPAHTPGPRLRSRHVTGSRWHYFKLALIRHAKEALYNWQNLQETDSVGMDYLKHYYEIAGLGEPYVEENGNITWSAAFISYLVTIAGGQYDFQRSARHIDYIRIAKNNRTNENYSNPFWLYAVDEYDPSIGDIVCKDRAPQGGLALTYDNVLDHDPAYINHNTIPPDFRPAHCDVIVKIDEATNKLHTIGGNVSNSVRQSEVTINDEGFITESGYFAIIKVRPELAATEED